MQLCTEFYLTILLSIQINKVIWIVFLDDVSVPLEERKKACEAVIEKIANRQVLRYPEDDDRGHKKGELILDTAGKPQYKACFFSDTAKEDVDNRTAEVEKIFYY